MRQPTPLPAASLILLREGSAGLEVLTGRRKAATRAFPGAVVFPGGKIEPGDGAAEAAAGRPCGLAPAPLGAAFAALRETSEETGLWLATEGADDAVFPRAPGLGRLTPYAHWITPIHRPYRFDTWFFIAAARPAEAQAPLAGDEFEMLNWETPADLLATATAALLPPTRHSLERLARQSGVAAALEDARTAGPFEAREIEAAWATPPIPTP